jgi:hypothetical protein
VNVISDTPKQCLEHVLASGTFPLDVKLGPAQLISQDRFATGTPKSTYLSPDTRFMLLDFGAIYRLMDRTTGDLLFEHAGAAPRFSHTGRYITSTAGSDRLEVLDILAKKVIFSSSDREEGDFGGQSVAVWMDEDALLVFGYSRKSGVGFVLPLIDERDILSGWVSCNGCSAFGSTKMFVDLDQMGIRATHSVFPNDTFDPFESSMLEVADPASEIALWERRNPDERGPPPKRPKFSMEPLHQIMQIDDHLRAIAHTGRQQNDFAWLFSDKIAVAFSDDGQDAELSAKMDRPNVRKSNDLHAETATHGKIVRRTVTVGQIVVSLKLFFDRVRSSLSAFHVDIVSSEPLSVVRPQKFGVREYAKQDGANLRTLRQSMTEASSGRPKFILRKEAEKDAFETALFSAEYRHLPACAFDDIANAPPQIIEQPETEDAPIISAGRIVAFWRSEVVDGKLFIVQQREGCGTAPELYGDLISVYVPRDPKLPLQYKRLAASDSDGGVVSDPPRNRSRPLGDRRGFAPNSESVVDVEYYRRPLIDRDVQGLGRRLDTRTAYDESVDLD